MALAYGDYETAPCLRDGPLAESGRALVTATRELGRSRPAAIVRSWTVPFLYDGVAAILASDEYPTPRAVRLFERLGETLARLKDVRWDDVPVAGASAHAAVNDTDRDSHTAEHYGLLFRTFTDDVFWRQPYDQLWIRLERNDIDPETFRAKAVLDAGCGCGRQSFVLKDLGAKQVTGIDLSDTNITTARNRMAELGVEGVDFITGSVLELPFPDNAFDVVFSCGVLHHTRDWRRGIAEMLRVSRPGGIGLIVHLNANPGGLFWDGLEVQRVIVTGENRQLARNSLASLGIPPSRIIGMLDHVLAPINERPSIEEVTACLAQNGAYGIRRFLRGTDSDRVERVFQQVAHAEVKYGKGENRFVFYKR